MFRKPVILTRLGDTRRDATFEVPDGRQVVAVRVVAVRVAAAVAAVDRGWAAA